MNKICVSCGKNLPLESFDRDRRWYRPRCKLCEKKRLHKYYLANKSYLNEKSKRDYRAHKKHYLELSSIWRKNHPLEYAKSQKKSSAKYRASPEGKFFVYKRNARLRNLPFKISLRFFKKITSQDCHYCGISGKSSIDRKNNREGYIKENCLPCCWTCNNRKLTMPYEIFIEYRNHPIYNSKNLVKRNNFTRSLKRINAHSTR